MKARQLLLDNVSELLRERHLRQKDLAQYCGHSEVWLSQILSGQRTPQIGDFDRMADFFGLATYQLFQPGVARRTERRKGRDRRSGRDRRVSHESRSLLTLDQQIQVAHPRRTDEDTMVMTATERLIVTRMRTLPPHAVETILAVLEKTQETAAPETPRKRTGRRT